VRTQYSRDDDQFIFLVYGKMDHVRKDTQHGRSGIIVADGHRFRVLADEFYFLPDVLSETLAKPWLAIIIPLGGPR